MPHYERTPNPAIGCHMPNKRVVISLKASQKSKNKLAYLMLF